MSLAAKVLEEMEKNVELRRKFFRILLADLMLDPDLRLAIVNSMIREVATKADLAEVEKRLSTLIEDVSNAVRNLPSREDVEKLSSKIEDVGRGVKEIGGALSVVESVGERFSIAEDKIGRVAEKMESLEVTFSSVSSKLDDSLSKVGSTATIIEERTSEIRAQVSRLTSMVYIVLILVLITLVIQLLQALKLIP